MTMDSSNNHDIEEEEDNQEEEPPNVPKVLDMAHKLHLLASSQHQLVSKLESKLIDIYLDSQVVKQSSIADIFQKAWLY